MQHIQIAPPDAPKMILTPVDDTLVESDLAVFFQIAADIVDNVRAHHDAEETPPALPLAE